MGFHSRGAQLGWLPVGKKIIIYAQKKQSSMMREALWTSEGHNFEAHYICISV